MARRRPRADDELAGEVHERVEPRGRDALDEQMRIADHEQAILERARLGLVGIAHEVDLLCVLGQEAPLHAGGETRAATAAQVRGLDLVDQGRPLDAKRLAERLPTATRLIGRQLLDIGHADVLRDDLFAGRGAERGQNVNGWKSVVRTRFQARTLAQLLDEQVQLFRAEITVSGRAVDDGRTVGAADHVVVFVQAERAVFGRLADANAELPMQMLHGIEAGADDAADVTAHVQTMARRRFAAEHRVESHNTKYVRQGQLQQARHDAERLV